MDEIAERLLRLLSTQGPRAIATYAGTMLIASLSSALPVHTALFDAIGTPMRFDPTTLDKGGKQVAESLLGTWNAPAQGFDRPDVILLIGTNPIVTYTGLPAGSPGRWLNDALKRGCKLIVIDPRKTEVASKATCFLQAKPGHDAQILAAMINVILSENLHDTAFVTEYVIGLDTLSEAVSSFRPEHVAAAADIPVDQLVSAARVYASAPRGYAMAGVGPNMTARGSLIEYLVRILETICGRWLRAGEEVSASPVLLPATIQRAEATSPEASWADNEKLRVRGLFRTRAGMPTAALPDEILVPGPGQVRALICWGGNPAVAFPDQQRTASALESLDLFVQIDPWYSESARLADYVIAPTMPLEVPSTSLITEWAAAREKGYGLGVSYAQYTGAIAAVPPEWELIEEWRFFCGLMTRMGYEPLVRRHGDPAGGEGTLTIDVSMSTDQLIERLFENSRVPLAEVKLAAGGSLMGTSPLIVQPATPGHSGRLDVGNAGALADLVGLAASVSLDESDRQFPMRLLCRRHNHTYNSSGNFPVTNQGVPFNPLFMHPADIADLGCAPGSRVTMTSAVGAIPGVLEADSNLRRGTVSMAFGYGGPGDRDKLFEDIGSSPNRLIPADVEFDRYTGQPRMTNVPVRVAARHNETQQ